MKPLRLEMQAFGPFARRERVDFTQLGERATLFLIHGPTGAGKTSLLDAMCFALYGDTSGGERDARAMRSDHAPADVETEVVFEFALGAERYRVGRSPAQRRPKKRGEGFRELPASAWLDRANPDGGWTSLATQPGRVSEAVRDRLGFDSAQFRQVIVLPQGRFRELLTARSAEREAILETLFDTEVHRRLGEVLKTRARELGERNAHLRAEREALLRHAGFESVEALEQACARLTQEKSELQSREGGLRAGVEAASRALDAGRALAGALAECEAARRALAEFEAGKPELALWHTTLERARAADAVRALDDAVHAARRDLAAHEARVSERGEAVRNAQTALQTAREAARSIAQLEREQDETARLLERNAALRDRVAALDRARQRAREASSQRDKAVQTLTALERTWVQASTALTALRQRHDEARAQAERCAWLESEVRASEAAQARAKRVASLRAELDDVREKRAAVGREVEQAEAELSRVTELRDAREQAWESMHAARLAATLVPGEPCPVCGARAHPHVIGGGPGEAGLAAPDNDAPAIDGLVREAREAVATALRMRDRVRGVLHEQEKSVAVIEARLAGELAQAQADAQASGEPESQASLGLDTLRMQLGVARQAVSELAPLAEKIARESAVLEDLGRQKAAAEAECRNLDGLCAGSDGELRALEEAVPQGVREPARLEQEIASLQARSADLRARCERLRAAESEAARGLAAAEAAHAEACTACVRTREALTSAEGRFAAACTTHGFGSCEAYRQACLDEVARERLEASIKAREHAGVVARERLERAMKVVDGREAPDIEGLASATREAAAALETHVLALQETRRKEAEALHSLAGLNTLAQRMGETESAYAVVGRLAELANGNNPLRMTFQRFVLATLLDEVLEAASVRLAHMSRGRFELQRVRGVTDMRIAGGLELEVFDHYTGTARPANTLSGGEGFLASLALALGLADCVQSRSGGVRMDTLFIDEGFGSLDPESLDFALRTLIDLQQGGRLIGLISHVAELRERIDVRLEVCPAADGSHVRVHRPG